MHKDLQNIGLELTPEKIRLLNRFSELFLENNSRMNLISKKDTALLYEKHIYDSLAFNLFYKKYNKLNQPKLLDLGTGGGFPSVPISLIYKEINVTAIDSTKKKIDSIENIKNNLSIKNLYPICKRIEDMEDNQKEKYDIIVSRAMAELKIALEYAIPFLKTGGYFIAYKSIKAEEEIKNAQNALKILNSKLVDKLEYSLPLKEDTKRILLIIQKEGKTPNQYPRKNGTIIKKPL